MSSSEDDDGLPAWISNYTSPAVTGTKHRNVSLISSSDDDDDLAGEPPARGSLAEHSPAQGERKLAKTDLADGAPSQPSVAAAAADKQPGSSKKVRQPKPTPTVKAAATPKPAASRGQRPTLHPAAEQSGATGRAETGGAEAGPSAATAADATAAAAKAATPKLVAAPVAGEVPVMIPGKLLQTRAIAELESIEGGATDLTGDSGAVGRVLIREEDGKCSMQFDLKGIVYDAKHAATPGTLLVVNIGKTEAKVETVAHSFLQLCRANPDDSDDESHKYYMDEDEDNYLFNPANDRNATDGDAKPVGKKSRTDGKPRIGSRPAGVTKKKPKSKPRAKPAAKKSRKAKARK